MAKDSTASAIKALTESEETFRDLFEKSVYPVLLLDDGVFVDCNEASVKHLHCINKFDIVGKTPVDFSPERQPDGALSSQKAYEILKNTLKEGINRFEWLHCTLDGEALWSEVSLTVLRIHGKKIIHQVLRDIGKRKETEQALLASQLRLSEAMDLARIVYWELDPATETFIFNDQFYEFYGTTAALEGGYRMPRNEYGKRFVHPDDMKPFLEAAVKRKSASEAEFLNSIEHRIIRRDGDIRHVLARIHAIRDDSGKIVRCYGANQDITERKHMEEELRKLAAATENAAEAIVMVDPQYNITYVNPAFTEISGYASAEIIGRNITTIRSDDREESFYDSVKASLMSTQNWRGIYPIRCKDGTTKQGRANISPIRNSSGTVTHYVVIADDTTEQLRLEEQLRQSHKMEAVGTLAGGIAHDFNNILAAMIGFTELARNHTCESKVQQYLKRVVNAGVRGRDLVKQILAFSRKSEEERTEVKLCSVVRETYDLLRSSIPSTIRMGLAITTADDCVSADPTQLQQVIMNLGTNAAHAMRDAGGELSIGLSSIDFPEGSPLPDPDLKPGPYVKLSVKDTGLGMTREVRERVFEPFFTTKEKGEGTGMGLAVVHGIVKSHGGAVGVSSEPGHGSTFDVFLPTLQKVEARKKERKPSALPTGTERILFVDDEEMIVEMGKNLLESLGYKVTPARHPAEALNLFRKDPSQFDLVITDQTMPDMTGLTLAGKIFKVRNNMPTILCTGHSESVTPKKARELGVAAFAMKPLLKKELAEVVRQVLDRRST